MPTAADFDNFAVQLDGAAERMTGVVVNIGSVADATIMQGTDIEALVLGTIEASTQNANTIGSQIGVLAGLCRVRAEVCRSYERAYAAYERSMAYWQQLARDLEPGQYLGSPPYPPPRPAPWAERG